jgi:hypothetical protein
MKPFRLLSFAIIIFWLAMIGLLMVRNYGASSKSPISLATVKDAVAVGEEWMGVYFKGEKVGYAATITRRVGDRYEISEHSVMRVTMLGEEQRIESKLKSLVKLDYSLDSVEFSLASGEVTFSLQGRMQGYELHLTVTSGGKAGETTLPLKEVPFVSSGIKSHVLAQGLSVGKQFRLPFFDPTTLSNSEMMVEVIKEEEMLKGSKHIRVFCLKESLKGIESSVWITEGGETLREESPMGFSLVKEDREKAVGGRWAKGGQSDVVLTTSVPSDKPLGEPRESRRLRVRLRNILLEGFDLEGGRQHLVGDTVEIRREELEGQGNFSLPCDADKFAPHLAPTPLIQSGDQKIISKAKEITEGSRDAKSAARMLVLWVYKNIEKKPTMSIPSSLEVLDRRSGDCNEHTALFVALSRAVGLPARVCVGIVFMENGFFYHAWPEVFLGSWVAVDPTFNQFPADATHIRFVIGELSDQLKIVKLIGQLKVEVLDYS